MKGVTLAVRAAALGEALREALERSRALGFSGMSFDAVSGLLDAVALDGSGQREVRHLLSRHDQVLVSLRTRVPGGSVHGDMDRVLWHVQRCMQAAADLGAKVLCLDIGRLPPPLPGPRNKPAVTPQQAGLILLPGSLELPVPEEPPASEEELADWPAVQQAMVEIAKMADRLGQPVAVSSELSSMESLGEAVRCAGYGLLGIELDPVAVLRDRWSMAKVISELGASILQVRGRDALKGAGGRTQSAPIGRGSTNWEELLHLLDEGAFAGWLTIDPLDLADQAAQSKRAADYLRAILTRR